MLVKAHTPKYPEDFGLKKGSQVYLYYQCVYGDDRGENKGPVKASDISSSPVVRVNAMWADRDLKIKCHVADTEAKKNEGLQSFDKLEANEGMYFPYLPQGEQVTFHQGSVPFGLDLIFLKDDEIVQIEAGTKVGSADRWFCSDCSGVIEVNAGFCAENDVKVGDRLALFSVSKKDEKLLKLEKESFVEEASNANEKYHYEPHAIHLISQIADCL